MFSKKAVIATLVAAGLFGAAVLALDVDIRVNDAWAAAAAGPTEWSRTEPRPKHDVY